MKKQQFHSPVCKCDFCLCPKCTHFYEGCPPRRPCLRECADLGLISECPFYKKLNPAEFPANTF